ncbi:hypothetical protein [Streptomyces sp. NBC_00887]|uniref:hypothetical protein n=1 Tax=Streptomyces sp. NBC_00887 TaxID=2975859 RepID=UPI002F90A1EA|nr:hypothetical protein OG844_45685 [Streptomyces sp. NBC_00887]
MGVTSGRSGQRKREKGPGVADSRRLISEMGWDVDPGTAAVESLGDVLHSLPELGAEINWQTLLPYARLAAPPGAVRCSPCVA